MSTTKPTDLELIKRLKTFDEEDRSGDGTDWSDAFDLMEAAAERIEELSRLLYPHQWPPSEEQRA